MFDICLAFSSGAQWEQQWSFILSHWKPERLYILGGKVDEKVIPFRDAIYVNSAEELPEDQPLILMQPKEAYKIPGVTNLVMFKHPETCTYMFGSDNHHLTEDQLGARKPEDIVYIPTDTIDNMYSYMAGAVTLYDRKLKEE